MRSVKKVLKGLVLVIILAVAGLFINNRLFYFIYTSKSVGAEKLSDSELKSAEEIYKLLEEKEVYKGMNGEKLDLILYNKNWEFLISNDKEKNGWEYIAHYEKLNKEIYRRKAEHPMAFAVKMGEGWAASFATHDYYNESILEQVPPFMPPQLLAVDEAYYRAIVIHEMVHAYEGALDSDRVDRDEHYHDINERFYSDNTFNEGIKKEAESLTSGIQSDSKEEAAAAAKCFLTLREERRKAHQMTEEEITEEREMEWLEGAARYAEYVFSRDSKSMIAVHLGDIVQKTAVSGDDRYYEMGMAQIMLLEKLGADWQDAAFKEGRTLEECLQKVIDESC